MARDFCRKLEKDKELLRKSRLLDAGWCHGSSEAQVGADW